MIDWISLITQFSWRFGFNSRRLKSIDLISSSADVRRSRGKFDRIRRLITTNLALIGSQSSLNAGKSWWTQDLPSNSLNCFTNWSKVKKRRGIPAINVNRLFHDEIGTFQSRETSGIVAHDVVHVLLWLEPFDEDRRLIMCLRLPRSQVTTHAFRMFRPSDEDRTIVMRPHVSMVSFNRI